MLKIDKNLWGCGFSVSGELGVPGTVTWQTPQQILFR
jgi:hypothetical protein